VNWDTTGCEFDNRASSPTHTVCKCSHLTNFAIIFDPKASANMEQLHMYSLVLGGVTSAALFVTIVLLHLGYIYIYYIMLT